MLLFLAILSHQADVVSSFVVFDTQHYFFSSVCSHDFTSNDQRCMSSNDISNCETNDYEDKASYDSPSLTSEWEESNLVDFDFQIDENAAVIFEQVDNAENRLSAFEETSDEEVWLENIIDEIHNEYATLDDPPLYDTSFEEPSPSLEDSILGTMDKEIAMLVRCNERPDTLLIQEGRALPPLTEDERNEVSQLVVWNEDSKDFEATDFLRNAVSKMFKEHAVSSVRDKVLSMDGACVAAWMTKSLQSEEKGKVSPHDKRVLRTLCDFGEYGSGRLVEENFQDLYFRCIVGDASDLSSDSVARHLKWRKKFRDAVWRDIRGK